MGSLSPKASDALIPKYMFLTKGVGKHKDYLHSFELALRDAGIGKCNIVNVSSIIPPGCRVISKEHGLKMLKPGQIIFCVLSKNHTNEPHRLISAAIGAAVPSDPTMYGYISEYHSFGETAEKAGRYAEYLAASMLAELHGLKIDLSKSWDQAKKELRIGDKRIRTMNVVQSARGDRNGLWTTVVAAAVFILEE